MVEEELPPALREYVLKYTRNSYTRVELVSFLKKVMEGVCISWKDVKNSGIKRHVIRLRRLGLLCIEVRDKHCFRVCGGGND